MRAGREDKMVYGNTNCLPGRLVFSEFLGRAFHLVTRKLLRFPVKGSFFRRGECVAHRRNGLSPWTADEDLVVIDVRRASRSKRQCAVSPEANSNIETDEGIGRINS